VQGVAKTSRPTPTAKPTLSPASKWLERLEELKSEYSYLVTGTSIVYGDAQVNGSSVYSYSERCADWNTFFSQFGSYSISKELVGLTLITTTSLFSDSSKVTATTNCSDRTVLESLQVYGSSGGSKSVSQSCRAAGTTRKNTWSISTCSQSPAVCVNCSSAGAMNLFAPCLKASNVSCFAGLTAGFVNTFDAKHSYARLLIATFANTLPSIEYISGTATKTSVSVSAALSAAGSLYCMASKGSSALSVQSILLANNLGKTGTNYGVNVTISLLTPATAYTVYCVTMSTQGAVSTVATAIANKLSLKTRCCKVVTFTLLSKSVFGSSQVANVAVLSTASVSPGDMLTAVVTGVNGGIRRSLFFPSNITLTAVSPLTQAIGFVGADVSGWSNISVKLWGNASSNYEVDFSSGSSLLVLGSGATPHTPLLSYAQLSNDGSSVTVVFDSATDKGASNSTAISSVSWFQCSLLLSFTGATAASCQWSSDATSVTVIPNSKYPLGVGYSIAVISRLRAACPSSTSSSVCKRWPLVAGTSVSILVPTSPVKPLVVLALPTSIGSCDSLMLDFGGSSGSGGRVWSSVNISVTSKAANVSSLAAYLSGLSSAGVKSPVTIGSSWLKKGFQYAFTVQLCNFLGSCGVGSGTVSVLNMIIPYASIVGGPTFTSTANSSLQLASLAYVAACDGSKSTLNLQYSWSVSLLSNSSDMSTALSLTSSSKDPSKFKLAAYQLQPLSSYSVLLTVTNLLSLKSAVASVTVIVPVASLVVVLAGGSEQCIRLESAFSVDASGSYDTGVEDGGKTAISFTWSCYQVTPSYSLTCPLTLGATYASLLSGYAAAASQNSSSLLSLTIFTGRGINSRSSTGKITLTVLSATAPSVSIVSTQLTNVVTSNQVVLQGSVSTIVACDATWTVDDGSIDLNVASLVSPTKQLSPTSSSSETVFAVYLSLIPNALPLGSTLKFSLSCVSITAGVSSMASVVVVTNSPPTPGSCEVSPSSGTALTTVFVFVASSWIDSDLPLGYEIGFFSPTTNASLTVQSKSASSSGQSILPAGPASSNYNITGVFAMFDSVGASVTDYVQITVRSAGLNDSFISSVATALIAQASGNVDGLKQAISVLSTSLNSVNCTLAPNCTSLNRFDCAATAQTCGTCLSTDYAGLSGDSNELCVLLTESITVTASASSGGACIKDADCGVWATCDLVTKSCAAMTKSCPSNCTASSGHGRCTYLSTASKATLDVGQVCTMYDTSCKAVCACNDGWYGADCSLTLSQFEAKKNTTSTLLDGLLQVVSLETLDSQAMTYWTNALVSLSSNAATMTYSSGSAAYNISHSMLTSSITSSLSILSNGNSIAVVLDNIFSVSSLSSGRRRLVSSTEEQSIESLLDELATALSGQMVEGQASQSFVQSNFRLTASVMSSSAGNATISIPQSELETLLDGSESSTVLVPYLGSRGQVGVASLPKHLIDAENLTSDAIRITADFTSGCDASETVTFSFLHYEAESFGFKNSSNVTRVTSCTAGHVAGVVVDCSGGKTTTVYCDGSKTENVVTICPKEKKEASCSLYFSGESASSGTDSSYCHVVNTTSTRTTCECTLCAAVTARRKLLSAYDIGGANVVALTTSTFTDFGSVMESAAQFNSLGAVKSTVLVISMFAVLWFGTVMGLLLAGAVRWNKQKNQRFLSGVGQKSQLASKVTPLAQDSSKLSTLEECLRDYITHLFSSAYSDNADVVRFFNELYRRHRYLSVFSSGFGHKQWIGAFYLLSSRTASFFLLALFYNIQFPSDDGTCGQLTTQSVCVARKSIFNSAESQCEWITTSGDIDDGAGTCVWQAPQFDPYSAVVVSIIVLVVSVPLQMALSLIFSRIMFAPTVRDIESSKASLRHRRSSAAIMMHERQSNAIRQNNAKLMREKSNRTMVFQRNIGTRVFSTVDEMDVSLRQLSISANQLSTRRMNKKQTQYGNKYAASSDNDFKSFDNFLSQLRQFDPRARNLSPLLATPTASDSVTKFVDDFDATWGHLLEEVVPNPKRSSAVALNRAAARDELALVVSEADKWVQQLKDLPTEQVGAHILELFARDCLGQHSREAAIFSNKVHPFRAKFVLTWGIKCITFSCLLILNLYFIFSCMLYGMDKGSKWQRGWVYTCMVNLFVDIFINQVTIAGVIHYWVPNLIVDKARHVKLTITRIIHEVCKVGSGQASSAPDAERGDNKFSVTNFYFVSAHIARAFPNLLESKIVLANHSFALSHEQLHKFNQHGTRTNPTSRSPHEGAGGWGEVFGLWITTMLMVFGSQSMQFQEVVVNLFNPALVTAVAFVGLGVLRRSFFGIPIGAVIVLVAVVLGGAVVRHYTQQYEKSLAQDKSAVATTDNQQEGITGLTPEQYEALFELPRAHAVVPIQQNMLKQTAIIIDDSGDDDFDAESYTQDDDQKLMNTGIVRMQSIGIVDQTAETMTRADDFDESSEGTIDDNDQPALDEKAAFMSLDVVLRDRKSCDEKNTSASDKELDYSDRSSSEDSVDHGGADHALKAEQDISLDDNDFDGSSTEESMNNEINVDKDDFDYDDEEC
jgi:hypothetical protein